MKNAIFLSLFLLVSGVASAEQEVYVFTDYTPVRIMYLTSGADVEVEAGKAGLSGTKKKITASDIPSDRADRAAWKVRGGKIEADATLKKAIKDKRDAETAKKSKLVERLKASGLDDEDIQTLGVKI